MTHLPPPSQLPLSIRNRSAVSVEDVRCQGECLCVVPAAHQVVDKGTQVVTEKVTFAIAQGQRTPSHLFTCAHLPFRADAVVCEKNSTGAQVGDNRPSFYRFLLIPPVQTLLCVHELLHEPPAVSGRRGIVRMSARI
jgi:hypothetical protein